MNQLSRVAGASFVLGILLLLGYAGYRFFSLQQAYEALSSEHRELSTQFKDTEAKREEIEEQYEQQRKNNETYQEQLKEISGTVATLETLSKIDKELLQKYSKVYFLNENYTPTSLSPLPSSYVLGEDEEFLTEALPFLTRMIDDADSDDIHIRVVSGYRSFGTQAALKGSYLRKYGTGANAFSADQGYSEHQLGTAVDFTTLTLGASRFTSFNGSKGYEWLTQNAHHYGFVLSYPTGNASYVFEPWHWRFVGVRLATYLHNEKKYFYELDQREIDPYLATIFAPLDTSSQ